MNECIFSNDKGHFKNIYSFFFPSQTERVTLKKLKRKEEKKGGGKENTLSGLN